MEKDGGADVFTVLISCAVKCFLSFISSCGAYSSSDASLNLMYTSTLVKMMLDVFGQEVEDDQMKLADSISVIPKAPETFVHMLWGSSSKSSICVITNYRSNEGQTGTVAINDA